MREKYSYIIMIFKFNTENTIHDSSASIERLTVSNQKNTIIYQRSNPDKTMLLLVVVLWRRVNTVIFSSPIFSSETAEFGRA